MRELMIVLTNNNQLGFDDNRLIHAETAGMELESIDEFIENYDLFGDSLTIKYKAIKNDGEVVVTDDVITIVLKTEDIIYMSIYEKKEDK